MPQFRETGDDLATEAFKAIQSKTPNLVIMVCGTEEDARVNHQLRTALQDGLEQVMLSASTWILTQSLNRCDMTAHGFGLPRSPPTSNGP
jgi:hypothetical protein